MYLSEKPRQVDFGAVASESESEREMMIEVVPHHPNPSPNAMVLIGCETSSGGEEPEVKAAAAAAAAPKKRAETWVQEETRSLIGFRREVDGLFNTSKSNKHLWDQISTKMRDKGFDRSPTMCTDKWRNLLKEFKKARHQARLGGTRSAKMSYYEDLEDLLRDRTKQGQTHSHSNNGGPVVVVASSASVPAPTKVDSFIHFSDKGE